MRTFLYIIGPPGAGKSTLMAAITEGQAATPFAYPVPHIVYGDGEAAEIGVRRGAFSGTDGLAMSIQPKAEEWLMQRPYKTMMAEGDRLANAKFFNAVVAAGYELNVVYLAGSEVAAERRLARAQELGRPPQNAKWVQGRETKAWRLAQAFNPLILPAALPPDGWVQILGDGAWLPFGVPA